MAILCIIRIFAICMIHVYWIKNTKQNTPVCHDMMTLKRAYAINVFAIIMSVYWVHSENCEKKLEVNRPMIQILMIHFEWFTDVLLISLQVEIIDDRDDQGFSRGRTDFTNAEIEAIVERHNEYRRNTRPEGGNLRHMVWKILTEKNQWKAQSDTEMSNAEISWYFSVVSAWFSNNFRGISDFQWD